MGTLDQTAAIRQRTLTFRLRLNLILCFSVVTVHGWLPLLLNPRRNQYNPLYQEVYRHIQAYSSACVVASPVDTESVVAASVVSMDASSVVVSSEDESPVVSSVEASSPVVVSCSWMNG